VFFQRNEKPAGRCLVKSRQPGQLTQADGRSLLREVAQQGQRFVYSLHFLITD